MKQQYLKINNWLSNDQDALNTLIFYFKIMSTIYDLFW